MAGISVVSALALAQQSSTSTIRLGPLRGSTSAPRYFADTTGRPVYLTGSHVWWNLLGGRTWGRCLNLSPAVFDYDGYLRDLQRLGHNFVRLWTIELIQWQECGGTVTTPLLPWLRTGPGRAVDGNPRLDFARLDPRYFSRLRDRVAAAQRAGIYVSVMLFEGWSPQFERGGWNWRGNPYNPANNVNGVDGDLDHDGVSDAHTLRNARITAFQDGYVRKVVDTVNRFDNVLYEVSNEDHVSSTAWQYHMIALIKRYEQRKPKRHPVGMTYQHGDVANAALRRGPADWIAPYGADWITNPPPATGRKVVFLDTDHLCGICGSSDWAWKSFLRGYNPIYMDPLDNNPARVEGRAAMGRARLLARQVGLRHARPMPQVCSTRFCLAAPGREYVVFDPTGAGFSVDLGRRASFRIRWIRPVAGPSVVTAPRRLAGRIRLHAPWIGPAVAHLTRTGA